MTEATNKRVLRLKGWPIWALVALFALGLIQGATGQGLSFLGFVAGGFVIGAAFICVRRWIVRSLPSRPQGDDLQSPWGQ